MYFSNILDTAPNAPIPTGTTNTLFNFRNFPILLKEIYTSLFSPGLWVLLVHIVVVIIIITITITIIIF